MPHLPPTEAELEAIARDLGIRLAEGDAASYAALLTPFSSVTATLDALGDELPPVRGGLTDRAGRRPTDEENPLGAWYVKTHLEGAKEGRLAGRTVALKDNVMLAGVPMMSGSVLLEGLVPPVDATVVERILGAGGVITGKAVCESWCLSAGSHTADTGPVRNPRDPARSAGGSSSGCAALVAAGEVDLAVGGDQGGSIRVPSAYCGIVGMKPTHGLVPYTGILALEPSIDHAGPMTATVADNALLLEVLAGPDGIDGRQAGYAPAEGEYTGALGEGAGGLRIGVLREAFGQMGADPEAEARVRAAADRFEALGAKVQEVSVPLHPIAGALALPVFQSGLHGLLVAEGTFPGHQELYVEAVLERLRGWRARAEALPETAKVMAMGAELLRRRHGWRYYARATNLRRRVRAEYDRALEAVDVLLLPTVSHTAPPLPPAGAPREVVLAAAWDGIAQTQVFDLTHHPALSVPCGECRGLPVGMMLVGRHFGEATLYRAAHAYETAS